MPLSDSPPPAALPASTSRPSPHVIRPLPFRLLNSAVRFLILCVVWTYRFTLGPFLGGQCRHYPTCSQYMLEAVEKHGPWRGGWKGLKRICRCHPFGTKGFDPP